MRLYSQRSLRSLEGIHPDLRRVIDRALQESPLDFIVIEGLRTKDRQRRLVQSGASRTMNSRHITGHAVDLLPIGPDGPAFDWPLYDQLGPAVKRAAEAEGVDLEWGGDWRSFKDGPHFQLSHENYPASAWQAGDPVPDTSPLSAVLTPIAPPSPPRNELPKEVSDLITEATAEKSKTNLFNTILQQLSGLGISGAAVLAFLQDIDPMVVVAAIVVGGVIFGIASYTKSSRERKSVCARRAKEKLLEMGYTP